jgi:iron complex transport system substrate-binding protein
MPSRRHLLAAAPALALVLAACSTGPTGGGAATASAAAGGDGTAYPVSVTHVHGTTTIEKAPTRVATLGWSDADVVASLGVVPVGATKITWGGNAKGSTDWFDEAVTALGAKDGDIARYDDTAGVPFDAIAATSPDVILAVNTGISKEEYDKLSKIAPTVAYPGAPWGTAWEDSLSTIGEVLGRQGQAAQVRAATDRVIDDAVAANPVLKGKSAAWAWFSPTDLSTIGLYTTSDLRPQMLRRFGLVDSPTVADLSANSKEFSLNLSAEKASTLDADLVVFYEEDGAGVKEITGDPLLGQIPALKKRQYVASADNTVALTMSSPSPLAIPVAVESFLPKLVTALEGTPAT